MTEIVICSDLHIEKYKSTFDFRLYFGDEANKNRILIVAGDIFTYTETCHPEIHYFLNKCSTFFKYVVFVLGNHDCRSYALVSNESTLAKDLDKMFQKADPHTQNVFVLEYDKSITLDGIEFWGCTFWTKIEDPLSQMQISCIGDYREIMYNDDEPLSIHLTNLINSESRKALKLFLNNGSGLKKVVVSHFPLIRETLPEYPDPFDDYYDNHLEYFLMDNPKPNLIVYGHTHTAYDFEFEGIRIICNPRGYPHNQNDFSTKVVTV